MNETKLRQLPQRGAYGHRILAAILGLALVFYFQAYWMEQRPGNVMVETFLPLARFAFARLVVGRGRVPSGLGGTRLMEAHFKQLNRIEELLKELNRKL